MLSGTSRTVTGMIRSVLYMFLVGYGLLIIFPLLFIFISAFKTNEEIFLTPWSLPGAWDPGVFTDLFTRYDFHVYFMNSLYYAVTSVTIAVFISAMAAYALTRMRWKLKGVVMALLLLGLMIPVHSELVPIYILVNKLGLRNPRISLIGIFVAFSIPITVFILSGFIRSIPREFEEAAVMDGSSIIYAFFHTIVPVMKSALATVTILNFLNVWNDFFASLVFISQDADKTIQLGITRFQSSFATRYGYLLAAICVAIIPSMIVYAVIQDKIIEGVTAGSVKG